MDEELYNVLGVSKSADESAIKKAYRKIARENHPDLNPDDEAAEERFKRASHAFEVLGDPAKRKLYDEFGLEGLREGFDADQARQYQQWSSRGRGAAAGGRGQNVHWSGGGQQSAEFQDIFGSVFGGRSPFDTSDYTNFGGFNSGPLRGRDVEAALTLDFMTAVRGGEMELRVGNQNIKVRIPAGANDGDKLRLKGKGSPAPEGAPAGSQSGDLLLSIRVKPHELLRRDGLDLHLDLPVSVREAVLGEKVQVPTPHGDYTVTVPSGVHSGAKLRLKGKGVHRGKKKGNFYVVVQIHSPDRVTDEIREAAEAMDDGYTEKLRADLEL